MAAIGELFKFLGKNEILENYCKEMENGASNKDILDEILKNDDLMMSLKSIIDNEDIIKSKVDVIIGQKRRIFEKNNQFQMQTQPQMQPLPNNETKNKNDDDDDDKVIEEITVISRPFNENKAVWLTEWAFIEVVDHRTRMVTNMFECYY